MSDYELRADNSTGKSGSNPVMRFAKLVVSIIILLIVLGLIFFGLQQWREKRVGAPQGWSQAALPVAAITVEPQTVPRTLQAIGSLSAVQEVMLSPEVGGRITAINFKAGDTVKDNMLLVQLFDQPERADMNAAKTTFALAETQLKRIESLAPAGAVSGETLDQRKAERDQADAMVGQLAARIRQKQIRAPFSGEIGIRQVNLGQYLNPGEPIATLTALNELFVDISLPQQHFSQIQKGSALEITSDAWPGETFTATVTVIEPRISETTRNIRVQALLNNEDRRLRPGMYVTSHLVLTPQDDALMVPSTAVMTSAQGDSVIVIRGDTPEKSGNAEIVPVTTGRQIGNNVIIATGLKPGDVVVTEGQLRVQPGAQLDVSRHVSLGG